MPKTPLQPGDRVRIARAGLGALIQALQAGGRTVMAPRRRDGGLVLDEIETDADLPAGWVDVQGPGRYRLEQGVAGTVFGFNLGAQSWKQYLHPARSRVFAATRGDGQWQAQAEPPNPRPLALLGVRACEIAAIDRQARVFETGGTLDPAYAARRRAALVIAVNCTRAAETCFCVSMKTGPRVRAGFDLSLTEVRKGRAHFFLVEIGTPEGAGVMRAVPHRRAGEADLAAASAAVAVAARSMTRRIELRGVKELLYRNAEHPRWQQLSERCLSCGNCTLVCPTCFCSTVEDTTDLTGARTERWRRWDSCFTGDFSYMHGGAVRPTIGLRYRHWITHKLASWQDQFGSPGCVGCGRCIAWCPAGIDITEEVKAIRGTA